MYGYGNPYGNQRNIYPYFQNGLNETQNRINQMQTIPPMQFNNQMGLLGKTVDSIDVVKAMDIVLDGSVNYFPLIDGSAIVTKQLQNDGTSKTTIYKPINEENDKKIPYVTFDELEQKIGEIDLIDINDIKDLKDELKELKKEIDKLKTKIKGDKK